MHSQHSDDDFADLLRGAQAIADYIKKAISPDDLSPRNQAAAPAGSSPGNGSRPSRRSALGSMGEDAVRYELARPV